MGQELPVEGVTLPPSVGVPGAAGILAPSATQLVDELLEE